MKKKVSEKEGQNTIPNPAPAAAATDPGNQLLQLAWTSKSDPQATQQFTGLAQVRQARVNQLTREAALLTKVYGAKNSGVLDVQATLANQQAVAVKLGVVRDTISVTAPTVPLGGWVLYGHVRNADLTPAPQYTVFLADQNHSWITDYGYAFTDPTGYYVLTYDPSGLTPSVTPPAAPASPTKTGKPAPAGTSEAVNYVLTAFVEVSDKTCKVVFMDLNVTTFPVDTAIRKDILLGAITPAGTPPCQEGAPPSAPPAQS